MAENQVTPADVQKCEALANILNDEAGRTDGVKAAFPLAGQVSGIFQEILKKISWTQLLSRCLEIYSIIRNAKSFGEAVKDILALFGIVIPTPPGPGPQLP